MVYAKHQTIQDITLDGLH